MSTFQPRAHGIDGVAQTRIGRQDLVERLARCRAERRVTDAVCRPDVGEQRTKPTREDHGRHMRFARRRRIGREQGGHLQHLVEVGGAYHAQAPEIGVVDFGLAGQRARVRGHGLSPARALPRLDDHDALAPRRRLARRGGKARRVANRLQEHQDHVDMVLTGEEGEIVRDGQYGLVAGADEVSEAEGAIVLGESDAGGAALGYQRGPAGPGQVVEVGGPHDRAVVDVDEADVVGAAEGDAVPARGLAELVRKYPAENGGAIIPH